MWEQYQGELQVRGAIIMNLDVQALGFTPFESGCIGFDCTDDTVCLPELDKFMSVDSLF